MLIAAMAGALCRPSGSPLRAALKAARTARFERTIEQRRIQRERQSAPRALARTRSSHAGQHSISGTVYEYDGQTPAVGGYLTVLDTFGFRVYENYFSDAAFTIEELYPGRYLVAASREYDSEKAYYSGASDALTATWIETGTSAASGVSISLPEDSAQGEDAIEITVSGTCYVGAGADSPVTSGHIQIHFVDEDRGWYSPRAASIGQDGSFSILLNVVPGSYYVAVAVQTTSGMQFAPLWFNGSPINDAPVLTELTDDIADKRFHLTMGGVIEGVASVSDGSDLDYASIAAVNSQGVVYGSDHVSSDSIFRLTGLPADTYYVKVRYSDAYKSLYHDGAQSVDEATPIVVGAGQTIDNLALTLYPQNAGAPGMGSVSGVVRDAEGEPIEEAQVMLIPIPMDSPQEPPHGITDSAGGYQIDIAAQQQYIMQASDNYWETVDYYAVPVYHDGAYTMAGAETLTVAAGQELTVDLTIGRGGSAAGFTLDAQGNRLEGQGDISVLSANSALVWPMAAKNDEVYGEPSFLLSELGGYRLTGLPAGDGYSLFFPRWIIGSDIPETGFSLPRMDSVTIAAGQTTVIDPISAESCAGKITGTACGGSSWAYTYVLCFDRQGNLASLSMPDIFSDDDWAIARYPVQGDLFEFDYSFANTYSASAPRSFSYTAAYLPAGEYALAVMTETDDGLFPLSWYGGGQSAFTGYELFNVDIPSEAEWVTVEEDQTVTGIDFCSAPVRRAHAPRSRRSALSARTLPGGDIALAYALPAGAESGVVEIFSLDGARVGELPVDAAGRRAVWRARRGGVAGGAYVIRLRAGGFETAARVMAW
jgi:hypothetical protein